MTVIDDHSSPHDAADEARAEDPPEPGEDWPLDLECLPEAVGDDPQAIGMVEALISEVRHLRAEIARLEALPTREEWTVTPRQDVTPAQLDPLMRRFDSGDLAAETAARNGWQLWRQRSSVHPWEPIDLDAPF